MNSSEVTQLTDQTFRAEVLDGDLPALVDFTAVHCGPCRSLLPTIEALARDHRGRLKVGKLDVDDHPATAQHYQVRSIPTLMLFRNGKVIAQIVGAVPRARIESAIRDALTNR
jgi:thioredoxin 1